MCKFNESPNTLRRPRNEDSANYPLPAKTANIHGQQAYSVLKHRRVIEAEAEEIGIISGPNKDQVVETVNSTEFGCRY